ncbi:Na+/H+ antiporter subunit E [Roseomonas sp. NAR14]|uniref:Na+/H+ antiporter subunit E n=1 Tax=Roseomonas acroporae TaxID=2937791 RepID=A0A9X2BT66_9PROT|nr:Na+/H+ antiporter subunit E [Roseomonas acroporae]MCK8783026.1 Na+/H+ antiporter subunit E [Roseomonas acroporae]
MRRLLPFLLLWACLCAMWLLLVGGVSPGSLLLGAALAAGACWGYALLEPGRARLRRPLVAARLFLDVLADVIRSNVAVAGIILRPGRADRRAGFVRIPLALRAPGGLAVLACILTAAPGTAWVEYDSATGVLLLHILDLVEEETWVRTVKDRYERPLLEIFA